MAKPGSELALIDPSDPYQQELKQIEQAILETQASTSPEFIAEPWRRGRLLEQLEERRQAVKKAQQAALVQAAQKQIREARQKAWEELAPDREKIAARWNNLRQELAALLREIAELDAVHVTRADRRMLSEPVIATSLAVAELEAVTNRVIVRRAPQGL